MSTGIPYLDETWNPVTGCSPVSEGCENCYAEAMTRRFWKSWGCEPPPNHFKVRFHSDRLDIPLHWKKPRRVGVCFMGDLFHDKVPRTTLARVLDASFAAYINRGHILMFLTKRAERMAKETLLWSAVRGVSLDKWDGASFGVTVENSDNLWRVNELLKIKAAMRWLSLEPLLSAVDLQNVDGNDVISAKHDSFWRGIDALRPKTIDWVVIGCESGPKRRPCKLEWILDVVKQCKAAGVKCYVKQVAVPDVGLRELAKYIGLTDPFTPYSDRITQWDIRCREIGWRVSHDPREWPEELRIRQYPDAINE